MANASVEFDGKVYTFGDMPAPEAVKLQVLLCNSFGSIDATTFRNTNNDGDVFVKGLASVISGLQPDKVLQILNLCFPYIRVDGKPLDMLWQSHFTRKTSIMYQVLFAFVQYQLDDCFSFFGSLSLPKAKGNVEPLPPPVP